MNRFIRSIALGLTCAATGASFVRAADPPKAVSPLFAKEISAATGAADVKVDLKGAKELYLVASQGPNGIAADWTDWVDPVLVMKDGKREKLNGLKMKSATTGFGHVEVDLNCKGEDMHIQGLPDGAAARLSGIGTHANSVIAFDLPDGVERLEAKVGLDLGGTKQHANNKVLAMVFTTAPPTKIAQGSGSSEKPYGLAAAQELMKGFKTPKGLAASLFAAEPQIQNPTNIDIDARGRVWAVECVNYRSWGTLRPEGDRIVILEGTKGNGEDVKETTFWQSPDLKNGLGLCVLPMPNGKGTQVLLSASATLWLLTDADGDDHAEKIEPLLKLGGSWNHDHHLHAASFGPDGKFYFNFGNAGTDVSYPDGTPVKDLMGHLVKGDGKPYRQGMIVRCDIDLAHAKVSNVETLAFNFRNNYKVCEDSFGGMWQSDNDDDGNKGVRINAILDFGSYGYTDELTGAGWNTHRTNMETEIPLRHWHQNDPGTIPNLLQTGGGSPTGICVNESPVLGKVFQNEIIHCDAGPRVVRAYPVRKLGAGYTATIEDILTSDDTWYRPSDCGIAPDGSLFVADWYDPGVGGHAMGDNEPGKIRGRIYRVAPEKLAYTPKAPDFSTLEGCVEGLESPNNSTRYVAWSILAAKLKENDKLVTKKEHKDRNGVKSTTFSMGDKDTGISEAEKALLVLWQSDNVRYRARALHLLLRTPGKGASYMEKALNDENPDIRVTAARELRLDAAPQFLPVDGKVQPDSLGIFAENQSVADYLLPYINKEPNKQVLREFALALHVSRNPVNEAKVSQVTIEKSLPKDPSSADTPSKDASKPEPAKPASATEPTPPTVEVVSVPFADETPQAWASLALKHDGNDRWYLEALGIGSVGREDACFQEWIQAVGDRWNTGAGRDIVWRVRSLAALDYLVKLLTSKKGNDEEFPKFLREFDFLPSGEAKNEALIEIIKTHELAANISHDVLKRLAAAGLGSQPDVKQAMSAAIMAASGKPELIELVKEFGLTGNDPQVLEIALANTSDPRALTGIKILLKTPEGRGLLTDTLNSPKADKLVNLLGGSGDKAAVALLTGILTDTTRETSVRGSAVKALALSAGGAKAMVELASTGKFPEDQKSTAATSLAMVAYPGISEHAKEVFPPPQSAGGKALPPISELVKLKGDHTKGPAIFIKGSCVGCHRIGNLGVDFAPALSEIGSKLGKDALYDSIINPNAGISMGFETWQIKFKNGQIAMGLMRGETNEQLTMAMPGGVMNVYQKNEIAERTKLPFSMMPTGIQQILTQDELVDLVEYLSTLKAPKGATAKK